MVKGKLKVDAEEESEYEYDDDIYIVSLDKFIGVPYKYRGLDDDLYDFKKLIEFFGENIINEEKKANRAIAQILEEGIYTDSIYDHDHIFNYRRLTLTSTFLAIFSTFEGRLKQFCILLQEHRPDLENQFKPPDQDVIEACISYLVKRFKEQIRSIQEDKKRRLFYRDVRNKIIHHSSIVDLSLPSDKKLIKEIENRTDILAKKLQNRDSNQKNEKYMLEIKKSIFLKDYIDLIQKKLQLLYYAARKL
jgi:hypothetical protein